MIFVIHCTKVQTFMPFLGDRPWNFAHVFDAPLPSLLRMNRVLFSFFSLETWDPLRPKYPKNTKPKYLAKKTKKMQKARQGRIKHVCVQKFSVLSLKNGVDIDWTLKGIGVICSWLHARTSLYYLPNLTRDKNEGTYRGEGATPVTTAFVQKIAEGKTSYELWAGNESEAIEKTTTKNFTKGRAVTWKWK